MSNTKLQAARELIEEKRYTEARVVLKTIPNDATAKRWLAKLDEIAPEKSTRSSFVIPVLVIGFLLIAVVSVAVLLISRGTSSNSASEPTQVVVVPTLLVVSPDTATPTEIPATDTQLPPSVTSTQTATLLPSITPLPSSTPTTESYPYSLSDWFLLTQVSPFDDTVVMGVVRDANTPINAWVTNPTPTLFFRCGDEAFSVFINIGATLENDPNLIDQVMVTLRYDQEEAFDEVVHVGVDEDTVIFSDPIKTLNAMLTHQTLAFGVTPYNANFTYTTFTLDGLRPALQPLIEVCNLNVPS
ncbi:MAG: hypothetical protein ABI835_16975 [Chloroflexota bacterium]